jgi:hypothetical protein
MAFYSSNRAERVKSRSRHPVQRWVVLSAGVAAFALAAIASIAPPPPASAAAEQAAYLASHGQEFIVNGAAADESVSRSGYSATAGYETLATNATNADWAKLVLLYGKFPMTSNNVTVFLEWMRQENGPPNWFNRNNPLNNGLGSGGNAGTGSYANLLIAAQYAAENLRRPIFSGIANAFDASGSIHSVAAAIWASPWSTSHYANGTHWSSAPVDIVKAPAGDW